MGIRSSVLLISFFLITIQAKASSDCADRISKIVCQVAPTKKIQDRFTLNRTCLNKPVEKYQKIIKDAFEQFPPFLQERFCTIEKIYIEDDFFGAAWSVPVDEKNPGRFLIGLRKAELDLNLSFPDGLTQFDSQTFGDSKKVVSYVAAPSRLLTSTAFTLIHELGHTFDYENNYNRPPNDAQFPKSWTAISWRDNQEIQPAMNFPLRRAICLNNCGGKYVPESEALSLYSGMYAHGFLSQLSATNAMEDFADSFAFFITDEVFHVSVHVDVNGSKFDLHQIERSKAFSKKWEFLKRAFKIGIN